MLTQTMGPLRQPVAYLSKTLVAAGWLACLHIIAAVALLLIDADKLMPNFGYYDPLCIVWSAEAPRDRWLSNVQMTHFQALLLNPTQITFHVPIALNPVTLLPDLDLETLLHDCSGILAQVRSIRPDLKDIPFPDLEVTWFTDGCSYV